MSLWIESVTTSQLEVCLQESRIFDGPHENIMVVSLSTIVYSQSKLNMFSLFKDITQSYYNQPIECIRRC